MSGYAAISADGLTAAWVGVADDFHERLDLRWQNEAWTATVSVQRDRIEYVIRLSPIWQVRQALLFRDMPKPDLWLGTDGQGHWGEVNGTHRPELDGALDVGFGRSPFAALLPIRRLSLAVGESADVSVLAIDTDTLEVRPMPRMFTRLAERRWRVSDDAGSFEAAVDAHGLALDVADEFQRMDR